MNKALIVCCFLLGSGQVLAASAHDRFLEGQAALQGGAPGLAVTEFEAAYAMQPAPSLLFWLGEAHRAAGHNEKAIESYKKYLVEMPKGPNVEDARAHLAEVTKAFAKEKRAKKVVEEGLALDLSKPAPHADKAPAPKATPPAQPPLAAHEMELPSPKAAPAKSASLEEEPLTLMLTAPKKAAPAPAPAPHAAAELPLTLPAPKKTTPAPSPAAPEALALVPLNSEAAPAPKPAAPPEKISPAPKPANPPATTATLSVATPIVSTPAPAPTPAKALPPAMPKPVAATVATSSPAQVSAPPAPAAPSPAPLVYFGYVARLVAPRGAIMGNYATTAGLGSEGTLYTHGVDAGAQWEQFKLGGYLGFGTESGGGNDTLYRYELSLQFQWVPLGPELLFSPYLGLRGGMALAKGVKLTGSSLHGGLVLAPEAGVAFQPVRAFVLTAGMSYDEELGLSLHNGANLSGYAFQVGAAIRL